MADFIATANPGFAPFAMEELRRSFSGIGQSGLAPGETFKVSTGAMSAREWVELLKKKEPIFLRHVFPVDEEVPMSDSQEETAAALVRFASANADRLEGTTVAVQVRKSQDSVFPFSSAEGRDAVAPTLRELGAEVVARDSKWILSVYAAKRSLYMGLSHPEDNLSDWPGGAVRFRREEGLISRAAFKLLEAEKAFKLPLQGFMNALDLGAAPGGWTSVLLERGVKVTAVDPAEMDESLLLHPHLRHLRKNAAEVKFAPGTFDLLVCDMSWDPHHTCRIVSELAPALSAGASGIITLKLMYRKPMQTIQDLLQEYKKHFEIRQVKQLFHNREEVTIWVKRRP
ncbi:SAM-dependent methyltransferase [Cohnella thailandensis]|uniref:SAM-dependent methyltransferase n=1 Tax=Cohnella thailandensis TaxID=557557 RepID=A0A841T1S7_9BACL|nr:SAM-dependent methyltransferase [Cohnella thailandensis]MBB6638353.1 SAM-dependent methyltransferase [Cohnella thailandensis]MBP1977169.1 23S rRNA (cytidine2498-2'-O)-methyltransferase [Cohnella thailandensis]